MFGALWMGIAHLVGGLVRRIGSSARELDVAHRRDGVGLSLVGAGIVIAAAVWWSIDSTVAEVIRTVVAGTVGAAASVVPILLLLLAWRTLRHPDRNGPGARQLVGWTALTLGLLGLVHIVAGMPRAVDCEAAMQSAGGAVGFVASTVLADLLTVWVATPLLVLLSIFGLLVVTGTPVHDLPARGRAVRGWLVGGEAESGADDAFGRLEFERRPHRGHGLGLLVLGQMGHDVPLLVIAAALDRLIGPEDRVDRRAQGLRAVDH